MPTTPITVLALQSIGATTPNLGLKVLRTVADVTNQNQFAWTGREILLAFNTGATSHNVSIQSASLGGRAVANVSAPIAALGDSLGGDVLAWYDFRFGSSWVKTGSIVEFGADNAEVRFAIVRLPF